MDYLPYYVYLVTQLRDNAIMTDGGGQLILSHTEYRRLGTELTGDFHGVPVHRGGEEYHLPAVLQSCFDDGAHHVGVHFIQHSVRLVHNDSFDGVSRYFSFSDQVVYPSGRADDYLGLFLELLKLSGEAGVADNKGGTHVKAGIFSQQTRLPVYLHGKLVGRGEYYGLG